GPSTNTICVLIACLPVTPNDSSLLVRGVWAAMGLPFYGTQLYEVPPGTSVPTQRYPTYEVASMPASVPTSAQVMPPGSLPAAHVANDWFARWQQVPGPVRCAAHSPDAPSQTIPAGAT